ncbi:hypothetical protein QBC38DRAFT_490721 [Podospora fimiseda]|uniref:Core domain-containing protein n=1 Tax=Podospora fimiseda TaxID=252190 RepID=A0AAN7BFW7_9PEZI|nr:hypothetical protein QBC38DRAFT_490721 [Podospora fimiseda]
MPPLRCPNAPAPARIFLQLCIPRQAATPIRHTIKTLKPRRPWHQQLPIQPPLHRAFSTTFPQKKTHTFHNPQLDEEGKEMFLEITPRAAKRLSEIMSKDKNPNLALRIQVESGGCHGFQYLMKLVSLPTSTKDLAEDDTIFTFSPDDQTQTDLTSPKIILDGPSLDLLKGSKVDFTQELIGSQFKIVDNPLATSSCGCGTSFDIKI